MKSIKDSNKPFLFLASTIVSTTLNPTFFIAANPNLILSPLTVNFE